MSGPIGNCVLRVRFLTPTESDSNPSNPKYVVEFDLTSV